ncbi:MAG: FGGY family carbohydrate kinase [Nitrospirota bacterium]|nr:FGGY family carbohydrate kinase [Nitrospirota bacterium]
MNPANHSLYLALDQGGHASRALIFDQSGKIIAQTHQKIETQYPHCDWVEHDAEALVTSLQWAMQDVISQLGRQKNRIIAAGLATQRSSIVSWHRKSGRALSKVISWQDRRAEDFMQTLEKQRTDIHQRTGLFPSAHYGASKLRWSLLHLPEVQKAQKEGMLFMGPLASFLSARLTQTVRALTDPANAARTLLWNIKTGHWDTSLLKRFGIPLSILPFCVNSSADFGRIAVSGLNIPLKLVTGDQSAALFQEGPPRKHAIYINIGTGAFLQKMIKNQETETSRLLSSVVFSEKSHRQYALEGTVNGAGAALFWFSKENQIAPWPKEAEDWLQKTLTPPIFINGIGGVGSPFWEPHVRSRFIGKGNIAARFTAVVESILFLIKANLDEMNQSPKILILSGGLSASDLLCQKLANLSGIPILQSKEQEATARGLAYLLGKFEVKISVSKDFSPQPAPQLQSRYRQWLKTMMSLLNSR